jgi:hypothetical protein
LFSYSDTAFRTLPWERNAAGILCQPGRLPGVSRFLGTFSASPGKVWVMEKLVDSEFKQKIEYQFHNRRNGVMKTIALEYHKYQWQELFPILKKAGFNAESLAVTQFANRPYLVVTAWTC